MKNRVYIGVALFALAATVFFSVLTGRQFLELVTGAETVSEEVGFEQVEGQYAAYDVAYPVASFPEEYYSGDPDRVSRMAYVVYDEERQMFFKIVVSDSKVSSFNRLLKAVEKIGAEVTAGESPIRIAGSLDSITDASEIGEIVDALTAENEEENGEWNKMILEQRSWYVLEDGKVQGFPVMNLWICAVAVLLNILILLICLFSFMKKEKKTSGFGSDSIGQLLDRQRAWLNEWCRKSGARQIGISILMALGAAVVMTVIGFTSGYTVMGVLTRHLPVGLCLGSLCVFPVLTGRGMTFDVDKILKAYRQNLIKEVPSQTEQTALAEELLGVNPQWTVLEKGKDLAKQGILGERYWAVFSSDGNITVADTERVADIEPKEVSGQIRSGKVRMNYTRYEIRISYKDSEKKRGYDKVFVFMSGDAAGHFMKLARKRLGSLSVQ